MCFYLVKRKSGLEPATASHFDGMPWCKKPASVLKFEARAGHMTTPSPSQQEVTQLLADWSDGDEGALDKLIPLVQPELHRLAHHYMSRERTGHTLQTTALLNEAYLQLVDDSTRNWQNRTHFMAAAAQLMRRIMVDHARERGSLKRGGGALRVTLDDAALVTEKRSEELLALDEALERLTAQDPRKSRIVELRYFGGLTEEETAAFLKLSDRTVRREWRMARTWLYRALSGKEPDET
jgi:RNA polymerase sigma factor (TIGR02999 family)